MTKLLQRAFDEASKPPEGESRTRWVGSCWRNLPLSGAGKTSLPDRTIYLPTLPTKHWQSTVVGGLGSLIRKNCDLTHHCTVPENLRRISCRGSASSPSGISDLPAESESYESSFQACPSYTTNLRTHENKPESDQAIARPVATAISTSCRRGSSILRRIRRDC